MNEIEIRNDVFVTYSEIQDGEAIALQVETPEGITDEIILIRHVALALAKIIFNMMDKDEEETEK